MVYLIPKIFITWLSQSIFGLICRSFCCTFNVRFFYSALLLSALNSVALILTCCVVMAAFYKLKNYIVTKNKIVLNRKIRIRRFIIFGISKMCASFSMQIGHQPPTEDSNFASGVWIHSKAIAFYTSSANILKWPCYIFAFFRSVLLRASAPGWGFSQLDSIKLTSCTR